MRNGNKLNNREVELGVWKSQNLLSVVLCDPVYIHFLLSMPPKTGLINDPITGFDCSLQNMAQLARNGSSGSRTKTRRASGSGTLQAVMTVSDARIRRVPSGKKMCFPQQAHQLSYSTGPLAIRDQAVLTNPVQQCGLTLTVSAHYREYYVLVPCCETIHWQIIRVGSGMTSAAHKMSAPSVKKNR